MTQSGTWSGGSTSLTRTFGYDSYQRPCKRVDPEAGATLWGYDSANRLAWEARGQASTASCQTTAPSGAITYGYDSRSRKTQDGDSSFGYDNANNLTSANNATAKWTYSYNNRNQLDSEKAVVDGASFTFTYGYNALGNLSSLATPARTLGYSPDVWGRPTQVGSYASGIQYFPSGTVRSYTLGNGLSVSQGLDGRQRLASQQLKSGATLRQGYSYTYSNGNDLQTLTDQVNGADSLSASYDGLHRLQTASGIWGSYSYVYDPLNNLRSRGGASSLSYNYNASNNRLTSVSGATARSYSYNTKGEVTGDGSKSYVLNAKGQITTISGVADYGYDANGKRIKSTLTADGRIEYTLYSLSGQLRLTAQAQAATTAPACLSLNCLLTNVSGLLNQLLGLNAVSIAATTDYLNLQGRPLAEIKLSGSTTTVTYLHPDLLGSPRMATNSAGQTLWQEHYDPYGKKLNNVATKLGYTGHAYDAESGLTYAQARFYDGAVGRFLSIDPIAFSGAPFTFNRYSYANNNPYRYTDPTGMAGCETPTGSHICGGSTSSPVSSSPGAMHGAGNSRKEATATARVNGEGSASGGVLVAQIDPPSPLGALPPSGDPNGQPIVPDPLLNPAAKEMLGGRRTLTPDGQVILTLPGSWEQVPLPHGGGFVIAPPSWTLADGLKGVVRVQPAGTGSWSQNPGGYYTVYSRTGQRISPYSGRTVGDDAAHNPLGLLVPPR